MIGIDTGILSCFNLISYVLSRRRCSLPSIRFSSKMKQPLRAC